MDLHLGSWAEILTEAALGIIMKCVVDDRGAERFLGQGELSFPRCKLERPKCSHLSYQVVTKGLGLFKVCGTKVVIVVTLALSVLFDLVLFMDMPKQSKRPLLHRALRLLVVLDLPEATVCR